jgi:hypothetical protein
MNPFRVASVAEADSWSVRTGQLRPDRMFRLAP